jgi:hypothetical protein
VVGLINHFRDLSQNLVAGVIQFLEDLLAKILMSKSNLEMDPGLGGFSLRAPATWRPWQTSNSRNA